MLAPGLAFSKASRYIRFTWDSTKKQDTVVRPPLIGIFVHPSWRDGLQNERELDHGSNLNAPVALHHLLRMKLVIQLFHHLGKCGVWDIHAWGCLCHRCFHKMLSAQRNNNDVRLFNPYHSGQWGTRASDKHLPQAAETPEPPRHKTCAFRTLAQFGATGSAPPLMTRAQTVSSQSHLPALMAFEIACRTLTSHALQPRYSVNMPAPHGPDLLRQL